MRHARHSSRPVLNDAPGRISKRLVIVLNLAVLMVLAGGVAAYGAFSKTVTVDVDGDTDTVRTFGASVGSILESRDVEVADEDALNAQPTEPVSDGDTIEVRYAKDLTFAVDGEVTRETVHAATVGEALDAMNVEPKADAFVSGEESERLGRDGAEVVVSNPKEITVEADGEKKTLTTAAPTVADVLEEAGVELEMTDRVSGGPSSYVAEGQDIKVTRVELVNDVEDIEKKAPVEYRDDDELARGEEKVLEEGSPGLVRETVLLTKSDGKVSNRLVISSETVEKATERVIARGTADPEEASAPSVSDGSVWDRLAQCESGGNWAANTGNGYYGGVQFNPQTWRSIGGPGLPHENSREVQIKYAKILQERSGWGQWPACTAKLGLR